MTCVVDGCEKPNRSSPESPCEMHYYRFRRTGRYDSDSPRSNAPKAVCRVQGCAVLEDGRSGLCSKHGTRLRRHGDPNTVIAHTDRALPRGADHHAWREQPSYQAAHLRVRYQRGSARNQACIDCARRAAQWSYSHADPAELTELVGNTLTRYSADPQHYDARCVSCHKRFDLAHIERSRT